MIEQLIIKFIQEEIDNNISIPLCFSPIYILENLYIVFGPIKEVNEIYKQFEKDWNNFFKYHSNEKNIFKFDMENINESLFLSDGFLIEDCRLFFGILEKQGYKLNKKTELKEIQKNNTLKENLKIIAENILLQNSYTGMGV